MTAKMSVRDVGKVFASRGRHVDALDCFLGLDFSFAVERGGGEGDGSFEKLLTFFAHQKRAGDGDA